MYLILPASVTPVNDQKLRSTQAGTRWVQGMHLPTRPEGIDMTLDLIENHRQKYFCTAHY